MSTEHRLKDCPKKPNCVCTIASRDSQRMGALRYAGAPAEAIAAIEQVVLGLPRTSVVEREDTYLHLTFRTKLLRFVDDVEFSASVDGQHSRVDFRSASRLGYSDFGANRKRMEGVAARLIATGEFSWMS